MEEKKKSSNKKSNEKLEFQWKKAGKTSFIWITIILVTVYFSSILSENRNNEVEIEYTEYKRNRLKISIYDIYLLFIRPNTIIIYTIIYIYICSCIHF